MPQVYPILLDRDHAATEFLWSPSLRGQLPAIGSIIASVLVMAARGIANVVSRPAGVELIWVTLPSVSGLSDVSLSLNATGNIFHHA